LATIVAEGDWKEADGKSSHADASFKHLLPRQSAQTLPDLWKARLVQLLCGISTPF
jgi:hypothetical protein